MKKKTFILNEDTVKTILPSPYSDISQKIWYHGRSAKDSTFSLDYVDNPEAKKEKGGGFYFTNRFDEAWGFASPDGIILKCKLNYNKKRLITNKKAASEFVVRRLIHKAPNRDDVLSNFGENLNYAKEEAVATYMDYDNAFDCYTTIENDFYRDNSKDFLKVLGHFYDGYLPPAQETYQHIIIYRPELIKLLEIIPHKS